MILLLALLFQASVPERMQEALTLLSAGDGEGARAVFESIVEERPDHGPARLQLGLLAAERGDWEDARRHLEVAVVSNPQRLFLAWQVLGRARRTLGDVAGAKEAFDAAIGLAPEFLPARIQRAELAENEGDLWTALEHYRYVSSRAPGEREAVHAALANVARRMEAFELARCAAAHAGDSGAALYLRAVIESDAGRTNEAIDFAERALATGYENAAIYLTLGDLFHERMEITRAIEAFEKALALDPAAAESIAAFALTSLTTDEYERLRGLLERHVEAHPDSVNTLYALGGMYFREGDLTEARRVFEHLATILPEASQVRYNLGMVLRRLGDDEGAEAAMERFRELKAIEDRLWERGNATERLRVARDEAPTPEERHRLAAEVVTSGGRETEDLMALGRALEALGRNDEARDTFEQALAQSPYDRDALGALGRDDELALLDPDCES